MYTKILSLHNFLIKSETHKSSVLRELYRRKESSKKGVGDENLIISLKKMVETCMPILIDDFIMLFVLCGLLTEINALGRNLFRNTAKQ